MRTKYPTEIEAPARCAADALLVALEHEDKELDKIWYQGAENVSAAVWNTMLARRETVRKLKKVLESHPSAHFTKALADKYWSPP